MEKRWNYLTQENINYLLDEMSFEILKNYNINELTNYEKRKIIYEYLVKNKEYDLKYFEGILKNYEINREKSFPRDLRQEFLQPLVSEKGICNGFSQIYKMLLERVGIYSLCINCRIKYKDQFVGHQLNLVYNEQTNEFSFDDVTYGI